jgi:hypothetical protein
MGAQQVDVFVFPRHQNLAVFEPQPIALMSLAQSRAKIWGVPKLERVCQDISETQPLGLSQNIWSFFNYFPLFHCLSFCPGDFAGGGSCSLATDIILWFVD